MKYIYNGCPFPTRRRALCAAAAAAALTAAGLLLVLTVSRLLPGEIPLCPMLRLTGLRCPLCGGTRWAESLLRGDLSAALSFNPLLCMAAVPCLWIYLRLVRSCLRREYVPCRFRVSRCAAVTAAAVVLLFIIVRNTPVYQAYLY